MPTPPAPYRVPDGTVTIEEHRKAIAEALERFDMPFGEFGWRYLQAAMLAHGSNISEVARKLGMHRRTLQRMLEKKPKGRVDGRG